MWENEIKIEMQNPKYKNTGTKTGKTIKEYGNRNTNNKTKEKY